MVNIQDQTAVKEILENLIKSATKSAKYLQEQLKTGTANFTWQRLKLKTRNDMDVQYFIFYALIEKSNK